MAILRCFAEPGLSTSATAEFSRDSGTTQPRRVHCVQTIYRGFTKEGRDVAPTRDEFSGGLHATDYDGYFWYELRRLRHRREHGAPRRPGATRRCGDRGFGDCQLRRVPDHLCDDRQGTPRCRIPGFCPRDAGPQSSASRRRRLLWRREQWGRKLLRLIAHATCHSSRRMPSANRSTSGRPSPIYPGPRGARTRSRRRPFTSALTVLVALQPSSCSRPSLPSAGPSWRSTSIWRTAPATPG